MNSCHGAASKSEILSHTQSKSAPSSELLFHWRIENHVLTSGRPADLFSWMKMIYLFVVLLVYLDLKDEFSSYITAACQVQKVVPIEQTHSLIQAFTSPDIIDVVGIFSASVHVLVAAVSAALWEFLRTT